MDIRELGWLYAVSKQYQHSFPIVSLLLVGSLWRGALIAHQGFFFQHQRGTVSPEMWATYSRQFDDFANLPGFQSWWEQSKSLFDIRFRVYIEAKIAT